MLNPVTIRRSPITTHFLIQMPSTVAYVCSVPIVKDSETDTGTLWRKKVTCQGCLDWLAARQMGV